MTSSEIAQELKVAILYREENDGAVKKIADMMNLSRRTIYDYLDGRIKISIPFLHAAVIATGGDPDIKRFLEPTGWELIRQGRVVPDKKSLADECLDDLPALAEYHKEITDPNSPKYKVERALQKVKDELDQNFTLRFPK